MKIAFFDTKQYDKSSFSKVLTDENVEIKFFETKLNKFLSFTEREKIKSLVAENSFNILQEYIF